MAHGDIAVIAPQKHLGTLGHNMALAVDPGIDRGLGPAVADSFDFLNGIRHLHEPQRPGEQMGLEIRPQTEAHNRHIVIVYDGAQLVDLLHR